MLAFEDARKAVLEQVAPLEPVREGLLEAVGAVTAEDFAAPWNMPLCDNSAMDGFAVRAADCFALAKLKIEGCVFAGSSERPHVHEGCAVKIMTGAPIPPGADAVAPFEVVEVNDGFVTIKGEVVSGQHIRRAGEDVLAGEVIIRAGTVLRPAEICALASCGQQEVRVHRRPEVAILSTGDELLPMGEAIVPGKVIDSNSWALAAAVRQCGATPKVLGIARDNEESHLDKIREGLRFDVLITSAGVSAGERDLVLETLAQLGVQQVFSGVAMRPGAPTSFAMNGRKPVFCLPGNPVAAMITFEELVKPAILKMMGHRNVVRRAVRCVLQDPVKKSAGKIKFLRVHLDVHDGTLRAFSAGHQDTGRQKTMLHADALALLPADRTSFSPGETVDVHVISSDLEMSEE